METNQTCLKVLLFPYLAHGHISPFFELAKTLKNHNFNVYFCSTPINLKAITKKLYDNSINQVEIHLQSSPELPPHYHTTNGLPPNLIFSLVDALQKAGPAFSEILEIIQPDLVIYDISQPWLPPITSSYNIPACFFQTTAASCVGFFLRFLKRPDLEFPSSFSLPQTSFRRVQHKNPSEDKAKERFLSVMDQSNEIVLIRSSRAFEEKYIDFETIVVEKNMVPFGSLVSEPVENILDDDSEVIQWLNEKKQASTVYVSFGSECFLTKEEMQEVALGLEISNVNFIWVLRSPNGEKTELEDVLPEGFLDRIKGRGFIEEGWAPQAKILKHPSTGGFLSHCGWGSLLESITFGVPVIAVPMQYDQPMNAKLVVEIGVGMEVEKGVNGWREGGEIGRIIEEVVVKDAGETIRRKARELAESVRVQSREEVEAAVHELRRICHNNKKH
ncbi:glycosyltransferase [Lithospermum erythrorhizon]|uniref:Glycosyltransferase n=1 Tax=Lithospermum erythrorhizon TaxID=34254 RepID=A0AAV3NNE0_LITER